MDVAPKLDRNVTAQVSEPISPEQSVAVRVLRMPVTLLSRITNNNWVSSYDPGGPRPHRHAGGTTLSIEQTGDTLLPLG